MAAYPAAVAGPAWLPVRPHRLLLIAAVVAAACLLGAGAFAAGEHHQSHAMTIVTAVATVGDDQASIPVNGWTYGLAGAGSLAWVDCQS
jgi:hypothetical protein